ncbi:MAG: hypothetical protein JWO49_872 [Arthrobacter sp.]|nr:hypothetical protein [Arthrobacter sp.]
MPVDHGGPALSASLLSCPRARAAALAAGVEHCTHCVPVPGPVLDGRVSGRGAGLDVPEAFLDQGSPSVLGRLDPASAVPVTESGTSSLTAAPDDVQSR